MTKKKQKKTQLPKGWASRTVPGHNEREYGSTFYTRSPEFFTYFNMIVRCYYKSCRFFSNYGGRGITVSPRWVESFESFLADMGERPEGTTLDRIDNSKGYCAENCRWADITTQNRNRRKSA